MGPHDTPKRAPEEPGPVGRWAPRPSQRRGLDRSESEAPKIREQEMRAAPDPLSIPPPAAEEPDGDEQGPGDRSFDDLLPPLDDESTNADDDAPMTDPVGLDPPSEPDAADDGALTNLDLGRDFDFDEDVADDAGDALGVNDPRAGDGGELDEGALPDGDERDGLDDEPVAVHENELPELDADDGSGEGNARLFGTLLVADEAALESADRAWPLTLLHAAHERCGALATGAGTVVAGSSDLLWLDAGRSAPVRLALDGTRIASLALLGESRQVALCVTAFGRLLRRARQSSDSERLTDWRRAADLGGGAESLELCQLETEPSSVVARLTSGHLVRSDDLGVSFYPLDPTITAFALSATGQPLAALTRDGAELALSFDGGKTITREPLAPAGREIAEGEAPLVAAWDEVTAIADATRGLAVSSGGASAFRLVPGCAGVTAIAAGRLAGSVRVWAALYRETADRTDVVMVDVDKAEARVIGSVRGADEDIEGAGETARLERLSWDGTRLFGAGAIGLVAFEPPSGG